jgi:small subunit ribosomal protein S13
MARIVGVELPKNKKIEIALTYIYGIGRTIARKILNEVQILPDKKTEQLSDEEVTRIADYIQKNFKVEGELRRETMQNVRHLMEIGCYRGIRHKVGLPVRGQRTKTNARTRKGPRPGIGIKKKRKQ